MQESSQAQGSARQKELYEQIHDEYLDHYYDDDSMAYRRRFYYDPAFQGLDLNGRRVADLASGSGFNSLELLSRFPKAQMMGFDISAKACTDYRKLVGAPAEELDLTKPLAKPELAGQFDAVMIWGGLHHCVIDLPATLRTVAAMLKPGGTFIMLEPNAGFVLNAARKIWYKFDRYFDASTEAPLYHDAVHEMAGDLFEVEYVKFMGGPGYFLVAQSMIFRLPKSFKRAISGTLTVADGLYNKLGWSPLYPYFVARWTRKS